MDFAEHGKTFSIIGMDSATNIPVQVKKLRMLRAWLKFTLGGAVVAAVMLFAGFLYFASLVQINTIDEIYEADAIVVLTGGQARIPEAIKLLSLGKGRRLLISGVNPITTRDELAALAPNSKQWFRCCIDVDQVARDTIGNADETRAWVEKRGFRSLIVVTASYHMPRSLAEFRRALPDTQFIPYPVRPGNLPIEAWWKHSNTFRLLVREYVKFLPAFGRCLIIQIGRDRGIIGGTRQCLNAAVSG